MNKFHIRFNTKHGDSDLVWRVFEDGKEHLVKNLLIKVPVTDECTFDENGVKKWNICCHGKMKILDGWAIIDHPANFKE